MYLCAQSHSVFRRDRRIARAALASSPARIINTASASHQGSTLEFDDLQLAKSFGPMKAYGRSKLCNILFTRELARRLDGTGVTANCLHPGFVATRFGDQSGGVISPVVARQVFCNNSCQGRRNDCLSCLLARRGRDDRTIFLQVRASCACRRGPGRPICVIAVAAHRGIGRNEGMAINQHGVRSREPSRPKRSTFRPFVRFWTISDLMRYRRRTRRSRLTCFELGATTVLNSSPALDNCRW